MYGTLHADSPRGTVLAHGCFDLLHLGHIRHLQEARTLGDRLIVSVTPDQHVRRGPGRPVFTAAQRVEALKALDCVDDAVISEDADAVSSIERFKPAIYVKGIDYADRHDAALEREIAAVEAHGGSFHVTKTEKWSSSRIINGEKLSEEAVAYLDSARRRGFRDAILAAFERADKLRTAFIGETIVDEYRYVLPLGKPPKESILATVATGTKEVFLGGVAAASRHAEWPNMSVVTAEPAIVKTRFVEPGFTRKLFEIYSSREIALDPSQRHKWQNEIQKAINGHDVLVVIDFGHGLFDNLTRTMLRNAGKFRGVNAQTNTGNYGFNPVTRYVGYEYVCVDEPEARLAAGMQTGSLNGVITCLREKLHLRRHLIVTHGREGAYCPSHVPAFTLASVDTMGAGDAFLAATAPLLAAGLGTEAAAFVGNVAGGLKVGIVGHRRHVTRSDLIDSIEALLK